MSPGVMGGRFATSELSADHRSCVWGRPRIRIRDLDLVEEIPTCVEVPRCFPTLSDYGELIRVVVLAWVWFLGVGASDSKGSYLGTIRILNFILRTYREVISVRLRRRPKGRGSPRTEVKGPSLDYDNVSEY